jgi:hypothetical protein
MEYVPLQERHCQPHAMKMRYLTDLLMRVKKQLWTQEHVAPVSNKARTVMPPTRISMMQREVNLRLQNEYGVVVH